MEFSSLQILSAWNAVLCIIWGQIMNVLWFAIFQLTLMFFFDAAKETVVVIKPGRSHRLIHRENFQLLGGGISLFLVRSMEILHMLRSAQVFFRFKESLVFAPNTKDRPAFLHIIAFSLPF